jgi:hypothetical protein
MMTETQNTTPKHYLLVGATSLGEIHPHYNWHVAHAKGTNEQEVLEALLACVPATTYAMFKVIDWETLKTVFRVPRGCSYARAA